MTARDRLAVANFPHFPILFRRLLRSVFSLSPQANSVGFYLNPQASSVERSDFRTIEHLLRVGNKKLKLLGMPGVKAAGGFKIDRR